METTNKDHNRFSELSFDIKVYDRETGFRKRGKDPSNHERKAVTKRTGISFKELDSIMASIKEKY